MIVYPRVGSPGPGGAARPACPSSSAREHPPLQGTPANVSAAREEPLSLKPRLPLKVTISLFLAEFDYLLYAPEAYLCPPSGSVAFPRCLTGNRRSVLPALRSLGSCVCHVRPWPVPFTSRNPSFCLSLLSYTFSVFWRRIILPFGTKVSSYASLIGFLQ